MDPLNLFKIGAAFIGGLVVALGGALIYVHKTDGMQTQAMSQSTPVVEHILSSPVAPATTAPAAESVNHGNATPLRTEPLRTEPQRVIALRSVQRPKNSVLRRAVLERSKPSEISQNTDTKETSSVVEIAERVQPPPQTTRVPVPTPAAVPGVNENSDVPEPNPAFQQPTDNPVPAQPEPHVVTIAAGTALNIRLGETLSTEHNYTGDTFRATLLTPLIMDGFIIADRGSKVLGRIVEARRAGRLEGTANLTLMLTEINTTDGQRVQIDSDEFRRRGVSNTVGEAARIAGGAAVGAIIGAFGGGAKGAAVGAGAGGAAGTGAALLGHGKPAVVAAETALEFRLASPVTITEQFNH
jgi:hypothetical protein